MSMRKGTNNPLTSDYRQYLDISLELEPEDSRYYASLIGVLHWMVEMGWLDVCFEVYLMTSYVEIPREVHLQQI